VGVLSTSVPAIGTVLIILINNTADQGKMLRTNGSACATVAWREAGS